MAEEPYAKMTRAALIRRLRELEQFKTSVQVDFDLAPIAYVTLDREGVIESINLAGSRLLGLERSHILGKPLRIFVLQEDAQLYCAYLLKCRQRAGQYSAQLRLRSRKGRTVPVTALSDVTVNASGQTQIRMALSDMTEFELAQQALVRAQSERVAAQMKEHLVAMVSHELRTPLSSILLWSRILSKRLAGNDDAVQALEGIMRSADAQRLLIDDLLDTSRISSGKLRLDMQRTDLSTVFINTVESLMPAADAKRVILEAHVLPSIGWVYADPWRLRQIISNLVANGVKFTDPGGRVKATLSRMDSDVYVVVRDTGHGIDPAFLPHLFEPFHQADNDASDREFGGLGLGLSISRRLAELHGGRIEAASEGTGRGAVFTVNLPLPALRTHDDDGLSTTHEDPPSTGSVNLSGLHILLVEDEPNTRAALQVLVHDAGAEVVAVGSVGAAMDAFESLHPDLIVGDIGMPGEDGYSLIKRVRAVEKAHGTKPVPAIALTAFTQDSDREKALAAGFDRHMGKPVELTTLLSVVRSLVPEIASG